MAEGNCMDEESAVENSWDVDEQEELFTRALSIFVEWLFAAAMNAFVKMELVEKISVDVAAERIRKRSTAIPFKIAILVCSRF